MYPLKLSKPVPRKNEEESRVLPLKISANENSLLDRYEECI